ncbi:MAG: hypothetical protein WC455_28880 [Dehalococcoidia bacterium]|jgi:hypothetical protein
MNIINVVKRVLEDMRFRRMRDMCATLGMPAPPECHVRRVVADPITGEVLLDRRERAHSWTRNFYNYLFATALTAPGGNSNNFGAGYMSGKSYTGVVEVVTYDPAYTATPYTYTSTDVGLVGAVNADLRGIAVGGGTTAFSVEDAKLATRIAHGTGAGQLSYAAQAAGVLSYDSGTKTWTITHSRVFTNGSGNPVDVKEIGIYSFSRFFSSSAVNSLMERTVLATTDTIPDGKTYTVEYDFTMSFAAID